MDTYGSFSRSKHPPLPSIRAPLKREGCISWKLQINSLGDLLEASEVQWSEVTHAWADWTLLQPHRSLPRTLHIITLDFFWIPNFAEVDLQISPQSLPNSIFAYGKALLVYIGVLLPDWHAQRWREVNTVVVQKLSRDFIVFYKIIEHATRDWWMIIFKGRHAPNIYWTHIYCRK